MDKLIQLPPMPEIIGLELYKQYNNDARCVGFFNTLKEILYENADQKLNLISQIALEANEDNTYLQFYYQNLFGIVRSLGESRLKVYYDTGEHYENQIIWDDSSFDGFLDLKSYKTLLKWMLDYSNQNYTLGWVYGLVCEFCEVEAPQVSITEEFDSIKVNIARTDLSVLLSRIFLFKDVYLNVPICDIEFNFTS